MRGLSRSQNMYLHCYWVSSGKVGREGCLIAPGVRRVVEGFVVIVAIRVEGCGAPLLAPGGRGYTY